MSLGTIQIPVLFDMSGDTVVFGEEATGDFVTSHLDFALDMTTEANDISLNAADISAAILIGDQETGDNIFYSGGTAGNVAVDNLCNRIAKAITRGKLVHLPKSGNTSNSGIPMGGRLELRRADGQVEVPPDGRYAIKYLTSISPIGDEQMLGEAMARVAAIHLVGTPLAANILVDKNSVQNDLETTSGQTFNSGNTTFYNALAVQLSKVLGGSKSSAPMNNAFGTTDEYAMGPAPTNGFYENFETASVGTGNGTRSTDYAKSGTYSLTHGSSLPYYHVNSTTTPSWGAWPLNQIRAVSLAIRGKDGETGFGHHATDTIIWSATKNGGGFAMSQYYDLSYNEDFEIAHTGTDFADFALTTNPARYNSHSGHRAGNGGHFYHATTSFTGQTITHIVTVGDNGGNKFKIDGNFNPTLRFVRGNTYVFDQSDATNSGHQIQISETASGGNASYVTTSGSTTTVVVPNNAPNTLYYNCNPHGFSMGNSILVSNPPAITSGMNVIMGLGFQLHTTDNHGTDDKVLLHGFEDKGGANEWEYKLYIRGDATESNRKLAFYQKYNGNIVPGSPNEIWVGSNSYSTDSTLTSGHHKVYDVGPSVFATGGWVGIFLKLSGRSIDELYLLGDKDDTVSARSTTTTYIDHFNIFHSTNGTVIPDSSITNGPDALNSAGRGNTSGRTCVASFKGGASSNRRLSVSYEGVEYNGDLSKYPQTILKVFWDGVEKTPVNDSNSQTTTGAKEYDILASVLEDGQWHNLTVSLWGVEITDLHLLGNHRNETASSLYWTYIDEFRMFHNNYENLTDAQLISLANGGDGSGLMETGNFLHAFDASGVAVPALKSIYEQLMNVPGRSQIMETRDVSGVRDNSNVTLAGGFPFISGDKLVMFLRPKIVFAAQTQAEQLNAIQTFNYTNMIQPILPVYNISDKNGTIQTQTYSQSSSQDNTGFIFEKATDGNGVTGSDYWTSAGDTYNNTTGVHEGTNANGQTQNVDGTNTIAGEWGQVDIGELTLAIELRLTTNNAYNDRAPREFRLLGSTDNTNWTTIIHKTEAGPWADNTPVTFDIANHKQYRYYRYVVIKCYNAVNAGNIDSRTSIGHFELKGVKYPSETAENKELIPLAGSGVDIPGLATNVVATAANIQDTFPGNDTSGPEAEVQRWGWMGSANSDTLSLDTTDVTNVRTIDLHIWKITITL